jgi:hypothetical protein
MTLQRAIIVKGRVTDSWHIELDEPVEDLTGEVEIIVRSIEAPLDHGRTDVEELLRIEDEWRAKHGDCLRCKEDIDHDLAEERASWGNEEG